CFEYERRRLINRYSTRTVNSVRHRTGVEGARTEPKFVICHDILFNQAELALVLAHCPKLAALPKPMLLPTTFYPLSAYLAAGRGILTIIAIAIAATAVVIFFVLSTLQNDDDFGQPAVYTDEPTDSVCDLGGVALQGSIADTPEAQWVDYHGVWLPTSSKYGPG